MHWAQISLTQHPLVRIPPRRDTWQARQAQFGDSSYALRQGFIAPQNLVEIGEIVANPASGRKAQQDITIADLTGVAVQDIQIASLVLHNLRQREST